MLKSVLELGRDIKLAHSVFALPFALLAAFLAARGMPDWEQVVLVVLAMFFARTFAMLANRYLDREIDAANPRTQSRALPAGRVSPRATWWSVVHAGAWLVVCAAGFGVVYDNWWPLLASPIVLTWLFAYALTKRFTLLCHFVLGAALALSPLAAGLAIDPASLAAPTLWLLAAFVLLWVGGFDVIYAMADREFDQSHGLHSIPAKLGERGALIAAKAAHLVALLALVGVYRFEPLLNTFTLVEGRQLGLFLLATVAVAALLIIEHRAAAAGKFSMAFFTLNGIISLVLGGTGIAEVLLLSQ
jgi:4-hydroxybenzoate polyprenyltransferase